MIHRFLSGITNLSPDHVSSTAQTFTSTSPACRPIRRTSLPFKSLATPDAALGHEIHIIPSRVIRAGIVVVRRSSALHFVTNNVQEVQVHHAGTDDVNIRKIRQQLPIIRRRIHHRHTKTGLYAELFDEGCAGIACWLQFEFLWRGGGVGVMGYFGADTKKTPWALSHISEKKTRGAFKRRGQRLSPWPSKLLCPSLVQSSRERSG